MFMRVYAHMYIFASVRMPLRISMHMPMHVRTHLYTHVHTPVYTHVCAQAKVSRKSILGGCRDDPIYCPQYLGTR